MISISSIFAFSLSRLQRAAAVITAVVGLLTLRTPSVSAADIPSPASGVIYPFAMCSNGNFFTNKAYPPALLNAGANRVRLDLGFSTVRQKPGDDPSAWNWDSMEAARKIHAANPTLELLPLLSYGTEWAADTKWNPKPGEIANPPRGMEVMPPTDPKNLFGHFVYENVRRYKDTCKTWESWNEPDLPGHPFFKGTGSDFFLVQKTCYLAAKAADPKAKAMGEPEHWVGGATFVVIEKREFLASFISKSVVRAGNAGAICFRRRASRHRMSRRDVFSPARQHHHVSAVVPRAAAVDSRNVYVQPTWR